MLPDAVRDPVRSATWTSTSCSCEWLVNVAPWVCVTECRVSENRSPIVNESQHRVAIIDDDVSVCRALGRLLRSRDFQASEYHSAEEFLADLSSSKFCCLLVDIQLPGLSGLEIPQQLAARGDETPVIFVTAHDDPAIKDKAMRVGGAAFFRKTDPFEKIITAIREFGCARHEAAGRSQRRIAAG